MYETHFEFLSTSEMVMCRSMAKEIAISIFLFMQPVRSVDLPLSHSPFQISLSIPIKEPVKSVMGCDHLLRSVLKISSILNSLLLKAHSYHGNHIRIIRCCLSLFVSVRISPSILLFLSCPKRIRRRSSMEYRDILR